IFMCDWSADVCSPDLTIRWVKPQIDRVGQEGMQQLHEAWKAHYAPLNNRVIPLDDQLAQDMHHIGDYVENYRSGSKDAVNDAMREVNDIFSKAINQKPGGKSPI